jgi:perosamine synthetase
MEKSVTGNNWLYTIKVPERRPLLAYLNAQKIQARPLWTPMNRLEMYKDNLYVTNTDISGQLFEQCISIPCSSNLSEADQQTVIDAIKAFYAPNN